MPAQICPSLPPLTAGQHGLIRELDALERLVAGLPAGYSVFHSVEWQAVLNGQELHGEVDLVVLSPAGNMMLVEVKAGQVLLRKGELFKVYSGVEKNVLRQSRTQYAAMRGRLKASAIQSEVLNCVVLPDYDLPAGQAVVGIHSERLITASTYNDLPMWVHGQLCTLPPVADAAAVSRFLLNLFAVEPRVDALRDQLDRVTERMADGLATWVPRLSYLDVDGPVRTVRIDATAGSGKTQLAVRLLKTAAAAGQRALC